MTTRAPTDHGSSLRRAAAAVLLLALGAGCGRLSFTHGDAGVVDAAPLATDAGQDAGVSAEDAGLDAATPPPVDAGVRDAGTLDAAAPPTVDAGSDAGVDAGSDAGVDAGAGPADLLLWLELDDDPTDGALDSSTYRRDSVCGASCPVGASDRHGAGGASFGFDGSATLSVPGGAELASTGAVTVTFWVERTSTVNMLPIGKALGPGGASWQVMVRDVGVSLMIPGASIDFSGGPTQLGGWAHLAFTWDGAVFRLYRDGVAAGTASATTSFDTGHVLIGTGPGGLPFTGALDDIRIYDRALSPEEIAALALP